MISLNLCTDVLKQIRCSLSSIGIPRILETPLDQNALAASARISVVVPIHDAWEVTERCLESLRQSAGSAEVILVDDGSKLEETRGLIRLYERLNGWKSIQNESAVGHSRACHQGVEISTRPVLCLLNSDTVTTPWSWTGIMEAFDSDSGISVVGPSTSWASSEQRISKIVHCRHYWDTPRICGFAKKTYDDPTNHSSLDIPEVSGFAFFLKREVWDDCGGFDVNIPDYGNERELCFRLKQLGHRLVWAKNSYIHHFGEQSYRLSKSERLKRSTRAKEYIKGLHGPTA